MNKDEIKAILDSQTWVLLDETEHFARYRSPTKFIIGSANEEFWLKHVPKGFEAACELAARNVELWNGIHDPADKAYESTDNQWVVPYFGSGIASDDAVARRVFEIYKDKKHLVYDACEPKTFLSGSKGAYCFSVINSSRCGEFLERWILQEVDPYYEEFILKADSLAVPRTKTADVILDLRYIERYFPAQEIHADLSWGNLSIIRKLRQQSVVPDIAIIKAALSLDPVIVTNFAKKISAAQRIGYRLDERALKALEGMADYDEADEIEDAHISDFLACTADYSLAILAVRFGYQGLIATLCGIWGARFLVIEGKSGAPSLVIEAAKSIEMPPVSKTNILKLLHRYGFNMNAQFTHDSPELSGLTPLDLVRQLGDTESERFLVSLDAWTRADFVSAKEVSSLIDSVPKELTGSGSFNRTFRTTLPVTINGHTGLWVIKCPIGEDALSQNKRAIRKWQKIYTRPEDQAYLLTKRRWLAPYYGDIPAPDADIQREVLRIYRETGELVKDGCGKYNFLEFHGKAYCVDVDFLRKRRGSICSEDDALWPTAAKQRDYLKNYWPTKPLTVSTIHCIEYLESCLPPEAIKDTYLTPEMIAKLMLIWSDIRVNQAILDIFVEQDLPEVERFINAYHFVNQYQKLNKLKKTLLDFHGLHCLAYLISLDVSREIPNASLWGFLMALRVYDLGRVTYLAAELGLLNFLRTWVEAAPDSIDIPGLNNVSPVMIAVQSTKMPSPETRHRVLEFFVRRGNVVDLDRRFNCPGNPYHGWIARDFAAYRRDTVSFRILFAASRREDTVAIVSGAGTGFFSSRKAPAPAAPLPATLTVAPGPSLI